MDDLAAFLSARLDEDEHYLRTMIDVGEQCADRATPADLADAFAVAVTILSDPRAQQIVEQRTENPVPVPNELKRLLREVEADRKLIAAYEDVPEFSDPWIGLDLAVRIRAERFSDHPHYDQEWKP